MQEHFLHFVWLSGNFNSIDLRTTDNQTVQIIQPGTPHHDAGPDFLNARIRIGEQLWVGNVEIHVKSGMWFEHHHHEDVMYDTTILHVCYTCETSVHTTLGHPIPCVELKGRISHELINEYQALQNSSSRIPCKNHVVAIPEEIKSSTINDLLGQRLREKSGRISGEVVFLGSNWQEVFHRNLFAAFGLRLNKEPFHQLAKILPFKLLERYNDQPKKIEALLFGCAGFIHPSKGRDDYEQELKNEFDFLRSKHELQSIEPHVWKFLRLRPANFPTIRLAQLAQMLHCSWDLLQLFREKPRLSEIYPLFIFDMPTYWTEHYRFGERSKSKVPRLGKSTVHSILINAVLPFLFRRSIHENDDSLGEYGMSLLQAIPAEENRVTRLFREHNFHISNAGESQGCIHLLKNYCNFKRCLDCGVGQYILNQKGSRIETNEKTSA